MANEARLLNCFARDIFDRSLFEKNIFKLVLGSNQANQLKFNVYDGLMVTTCSEETYAIREVNLFGVSLTFHSDLR